MSKKIIGEFSQDNDAIFTFTPSSGISLIGGYIDIITPKRYDYEKNIEWPYDESGFKCSSPSFDKIISQKQNPTSPRINGVTVYSNYYRIEYTKIVNAAKLDSITITCSGWKNSIFPEK